MSFGHRWVVTCCVLVSLALSHASCHMAELARTGQSAESLIGDAIDTLTTQSEGWQSTLKQLQNKLVADGQDLIAHEVSDLLGRGAGVIGGQFSCRLDFIGVRMKQGLAAILAKLQGKPAPAKLPGLCNTVPESIDLVLEPQRRQTLTFYGYDLDAPGVSVRLANAAMPGNLVARQPYTLTVTLTSLKLTDNNKQIALQSGNNKIGVVNITYVPCGSGNQRCCKWEGPTCDNPFVCDGSACRTPPPAPCGKHTQHACATSPACESGLANIEDKCMHVAETDRTEDNCKNNVVTWKKLGGTIDITKGHTASFYVPTGAEHSWVCPNDDEHGNTTCPGDTNFLTVKRLPASQGDEMQITCQKVY